MKRIKIIKRPAFFSALFLVLGILSSYFLLKLKLIFLLKILLFCEILFLIYYFIFKFKMNKKFIFILFNITFLIIGSFLFIYEDYKYKSSYSINNFVKNGQSEIIAEIYFDIGDLESNKVYLKPVLINRKKVKYGKILIYSDRLKKFQDGDLIFLKLNLTEIESAVNPGGFSYADYLIKNGVYLQGWQAENIKLISRQNSFKNLIILFKNKLLKNINSLFEGKYAAFIKAILLGEKEDLSYEQKSLLRNSGASHILAISGLHMGIIILTFSWILFKVFSQRRTALYFLSILTFVYIIIVGAAVSIIRSSLLALLFLWADEFNREGDFLNIISVTLIINLLFAPLSLFTISLQLSYIIVLTLFFLTPLFNNFLPPIFSVLLAAQLGSFAISAYYFNEYAWIAFITNLWLIPFVTFLLPLVFLLTLTSLFIYNYLSFFIISIEFSLQFLFSALKLMTAVQGLALVIARPNLIFVILYYLLLFSLPLVYHQYQLNLKAKKLLIWRKIIVLVFLVLIISFFINFDSGLLEINYLAVGQGDGIFIKFPGGKNMIIDTGPPGKNGRNVEYSLVSFLNYSGIKKIDYVMISHFDADHVGGLIHLLKRKEIKNILIPPFREKTDFHQKLEKELLKDKDLKINYLTENMFFKIAGCNLDILNPPADNLSTDRNENSIVFLLKYKNKKFLFTGDLSKKGEKRIIKAHQPGKIDVLKAGHHGSSTSSGQKILDHCSPVLAVISVGENNFGHPAADVLNRFKKNKIKYFRTDKSGMIKILSDGQNIWYKSFK